MKQISKLRIISLILYISFTISLLIGCGGSAILGTAIKVMGVSAILPDEWTSAGGIVRIVAEVLGVAKEVRAIIRKAGSNEEVPIVLIRTAEGKYEANYHIQENTDPNEPAVYTIEVIAKDPTGKTSEAPSPVEIEVPPAEKD